jgi:hypothetical protein
MILRKHCKEKKGLKEFEDKNFESLRNVKLPKDLRKLPDLKTHSALCSVLSG